ncbi:hypothetical protein IWW51_001519, partial [Coemansia sp. RSA 2702]
KPRPVQKDPRQPALRRAVLRARAQPPGPHLPAAVGSAHQYRCHHQQAQGAASCRPRCPAIHICHRRQRLHLAVRLRLRPVLLLRCCPGLLCALQLRRFRRCVQRRRCRHQQRCRCGQGRCCPWLRRPRQTLKEAPHCAHGRRPGLGGPHPGRLAHRRLPPVCRRPGPRRHLRSPRTRIRQVPVAAAHPRRLRQGLGQEPRLRLPELWRPRRLLGRLEGVQRQIRRQPPHQAAQELLEGPQCRHPQGQARRQTCLPPLQAQAL